MITFFINTESNNLHARMNYKGMKLLRSNITGFLFINRLGRNSFSVTIDLNKYPYEYCMDTIYPFIDNHPVYFQ